MCVFGFKRDGQIAFCNSICRGVGTCVCALMCTLVEFVCHSPGYPRESRVRELRLYSGGSEELGWWDLEHSLFR